MITHAEHQARQPYQKTRPWLLYTYSPQASPNNVFLTSQVRYRLPNPVPPHIHETPWSSACPGPAYITSLVVGLNGAGTDPNTPSMLATLARIKPHQGDASCGTRANATLLYPSQMYMTLVDLLDPRRTAVAASRTKGIREPTMPPEKSGRYATLGHQGQGAGIECLPPLASTEDIPPDR